ncbi:hypothetical protein SAMN02745196_02977 [Clostridium collagenovorans DSM 3089]|uniref:HTH IS21-type domain-containing protein n=1 Tax=Clostridium collagenovorans DSM 3089 TaxID=1121306 RepID=A0A1M5YIA9_9CLOT|nr:hypothetical protein SAMN02745196_02977 [Clostridium collagenovorans DSM 3089]
MLNNQGLQITEISNITGYSCSSISKYLSKDYNAVHGQYGVSRSSPLAPYRDEILTLRSQKSPMKKLLIFSEKEDILVAIFYTNLGFYKFTGRSLCLISIY